MQGMRSDLTTTRFYPKQNPAFRFFALWYFTILLIVWTILGHTVLGFEQSYAQPIAGVACGILVSMFLEAVDAGLNGRTPRFLLSKADFLGFLPPAIIPGLACAMLIYANDRIAPVLFAVALSIASKGLLRAPVGGGRTQHVFNPSNLGITITLLLLPAVGLAPPYQFTENITGLWGWVIPAIILVSGITIHARFTGRLPLVAAWLGGFALQGIVRAEIFHIPLVVPFVPMTSAAFILFTLYMIPDPATTPIKPLRQVAFGLSIAAVYGLLFVAHIVFGLFIALACISATRGIALYAAHLRRTFMPRPNVAIAAAAAGS